MTFTPIGQTARTQAEGSQKEVGGKRGGTELETKRQGSSEIAAWLAKHTPEDMDKAAVSRASSHSVGLRIKYEGRYPTGPNGEHLPSYVVAVGCDVGGTTKNRLAAKADLEKFMTPAPIRQIEAWLAELSVISASRSRESIEIGLLLNAYSSRLTQYPSDVARKALLGKSWKWFPTWEELERVCETMAGPRRHMIAALSKPEPDPDQERRPATQEEKDRIAALVAEQFPHAPQAWRDRAVDEATKGNCMTGQKVETE